MFIKIEVVAQLHPDNMLWEDQLPAVKRSLAVEVNPAIEKLRKQFPEWNFAAGVTVAS